MRHAGFVLAGGRSTRMGQDKALLAFHGQPLALHIANEVLAAAGEVTIIGNSLRHGGLGYPVVDDLEPALGPAGGLLTALTITDADWNLVVACDMPEVRGCDLAVLLQEAEACSGGCLVPREPAGRTHPLCAVYHRNCLPALTAAIHDKILKMQEIILRLRPAFTSAPDPSLFRNINTLEDWTRYTHER